MPQFPELPILTPDPPRKTQTEKYGALLYLGLAGLAGLVVLIAWFGQGVWSMRSVWADVYLVNDPRRAEPERVNAAWRLARDSRVTPRQRWDLALSRTPPPLARYLLAESLTSEATQADPRGYALSVARSEGWPGWLRVLLARPLAYAAGEGGTVDRQGLEELAKNPDPAVALFAEFALTMARSPVDPRPIPSSESPVGVARLLAEARTAPQPRRGELLDAATRRLRRDHPAAARLWAGWEETSSGLARLPARELPVTPR